LQNSVSFLDCLGPRNFLSYSFSFCPLFSPFQSFLLPRFLPKDFTAVFFVHLCDRPEIVFQVALLFDFIPLRFFFSHFDPPTVIWEIIALQGIEVLEFALHPPILFHMELLLLRVQVSEWSFLSGLHPATSSLRSSIDRGGTSSESA